MRHARVLALIGLVVSAAPLAGCGLLQLGTAVAVGATAVTVGAGVGAAQAAGRVTGAAVQGTGRAIGAAGNLATGAAGSLYSGGELKATHDETVQQVWTASREAVAAMNFRYTGGSYDALKGEVHATTAANTKVLIKIRLTPERVTEITIRIGVFGKQFESEALHDQIVARLGPPVGALIRATPPPAPS